MLAPVHLRPAVPLATTQIYLQVDFEIKQRALDRTTPSASHPGRFRPDDELLAFLEDSQGYADRPRSGTTDELRRARRHRHNPEIGVMRVAQLVGGAVAAVRGLAVVHRDASEHGQHPGCGDRIMTPGCVHVK